MAALLALPATGFAQTTVPAQGDVNLDGEVNIADINVVISIILDGTGTTTAADVNHDGEINIGDINVIIGIILNPGADPFLNACVKVSEIDNVIENYYMQCETLDDLKAHASEIEALDGVEYIYYGSKSMFVEVKGFGTISYSYFPLPDEEESFEINQRLMDQIANTVHSSQNTTADDIDVSDVQVLIVNQQFKDEDRAHSRLSAGMVKTLFSQAGFNVSPIENEPNVEFFRNGIFGHDYVFLIDHGAYGYNSIKKHGTHWLLTSTEVPYIHSVLYGNYVDSQVLCDLRKDYDKQDVGIGFIKEKRNGKTVSVAYLKVSDHFINSSENQFKHAGKGIIYNVACESLEGPNIEGTDSLDYNLANAFISKGAGAYLGYDQSNCGGQVAGLVFWSRLLSGMTIKNAHLSIENYLVHEYDEDDKYWADLEIHPEHDAFLNSAIIRPDITYEDKSDDKKLQIDLHAGNVFTSLFLGNGYKNWNQITDVSLLREISFFRYGFELSESEHFSEAVSLGEKMIGDEGCGFSDMGYFLNLTHSLTYDGIQANSMIKPNTTYWVRAYVYDYLSNIYNYSEPISFTTGSISDSAQEHEWVDLGLPSGTLWATCNIGASSPEEYGDHFAWGETEPKDVYNMETYKWAYYIYLGEFQVLQYSKYNMDSNYGQVDNKMVLDLEDDAAYVNWGSEWRMPTEEQQEELRKKCTRTWETVNGVNGSLFTGPNGNSVFFPAAGYLLDSTHFSEDTDGYYWSCMLKESGFAFYLEFNSMYSLTNVNYYRSYGRSVRAVRAQ